MSRSPSPFTDNDFFAETTPLHKNPFRSDSDVSQNNSSPNEKKSSDGHDMFILTQKIIKDRNRDKSSDEEDRYFPLSCDEITKLHDEKCKKNWDILTQNMKPFPPDKNNSIKNPLILDLYVSGYYNSIYAISTNAEFYEYEFFSRGGNYNSNMPYASNPYEGEFSRGNKIGKIGGLYYKIIKTRLDDYDPGVGNFINPYGTVININTNKIVKSKQHKIIEMLKSENIFKPYKRNFTINVFLYKNDQEYNFYSEPGRVLHDYLYESFSDHVFLKTVFSHNDQINFIKVSKNIKERDYLVIDNIDGGILLREITHNEIEKLSYNEFVKYFLEERNIDMRAMMVIMKYMGNYVTGNSPQLWYISEDSKIRAKLKELTKSLKKDPIVKLKNGEIVLIEQPPINEELTAITEEKLILFFQEFSDYLAEYGAIVTGDAAAFMVNRKIVPPKYIDIWINEKGIHDFCDKLKKKKWKKVVYRYLTNAEKFSPQATQIMILRHNVYDLELQITTTSTDPRMIVEEISLSVLRVIWDPAVLESRDRYGNINQHVVNFAGTEQSVIDDILAQKAVFLERPWDYEKTVTPHLEQCLDLTKRTLSQLVEYMSKGFSIKVSSESVFGGNELVEKINNQNIFNGEDIIFNDYFVYSVNEEFKEVIETMIKIFEYEKHVNSDKSPGFLFIKDVMLKISKEVGYDQFNYHNLTLLDKRKHTVKQLTSFKSSMFDITPPDDAVKCPI